VEDRSSAHTEQIGLVEDEQGNPGRNRSKSSTSLERAKGVRFLEKRYALEAFSRNLTPHPQGI